jgi:hypothetical protein
MGKKKKSRKDRPAKEKTKDLDISLNQKAKTEIVLLIVSFAYITYFVNLDFFYDWDATHLALTLKDGLNVADISVQHFFVPILTGIAATFFSPFTSIKIVTEISMLVFVISIFRFSYNETNDLKVGSLTSLFILLNFGLTWNLTSLEDNVLMYAFIAPFILFLMKEEWNLSALFLSLALLVHIQSLVFIPMFVIYALIKSNLPSPLKCPKDAFDQMKSLAYEKREKITLTLGYFFVPLVLAYSVLLLTSRLSKGQIIHPFAGYHSNPEWWYFASDRTLYEQFGLAYSGLISTFVYRYPEFQDRMPHAVYLGFFFFILLAYVLFRGFSLNQKTLCAIPTFLVLFVHSIFYESWYIERWDFLLLFFVYFVAVGYSAKNIRTKNVLKIALSLTVILSAIFTYNCFNSMSHFQASPGYLYADELSGLLDDNSIALESVHSNSELGLYLKYKCGDSVIFLDKIDENVDLSKPTWAYASSQTYTIITKKAPEGSQIVWRNPVADAFNIVRFHIKTD